MWKTIEFEPNYEVSTCGEVRNKETKHVKSLRLSGAGYLRVTLYPSGKTYQIHRLVALTFLKDDYKKDLVVNHKIGVKKDNNLSNLEWVTPKRNFHHAIENGLYARPDISGVRNPSSKWTKDNILEIRTLSGRGLSVKEISIKLGYPYERVRRLITGQHYN